MLKSTADNVRALSDGIPGLYLSKRYRRRRMLMRLPILLLLAALIIGGIYVVCNPAPEPWDGQLLVVCGYSERFFSRYFFHERLGYYDFLEEFSLTEEEFCEQVGLTTISKTKAEAKLEALGLADQVDWEQLNDQNWDSVRIYYLILVDGNGNVLYDGTDSAPIIDLLGTNGFPTGG